MVDLDAFVFTEPRIKNRSGNAIELPWKMGIVEATVTWQKAQDYVRPESYWLVVPKEVGLV